MKPSKPVARASASQERTPAIRNSLISSIATMDRISLPKDLDQMLLRYWKESNTKQLNIRIPATAKRMIERLARRKTLEVSTLVRMWVMESMRREAMGR